MLERWKGDSAMASTLVLKVPMIPHISRPLLKYYYSIVHSAVHRTPTQPHLLLPMIRAFLSASPAFLPQPPTSSPSRLPKALSKPSQMPPRMLLFIRSASAELDALLIYPPKPHNIAVAGQH